MIIKYTNTVVYQGGLITILNIDCFTLDIHEQQRNRSCTLTWKVEFDWDGRNQRKSTIFVRRENL